MTDPRLVEIAFLSALELERPTSLTWWDWAKRLDVSKEVFMDLVFGLFRDGCLEGTSTITPPTEQFYNDRPVHPSGTWGEKEIDRSVRTLLSGANSFAVYINHAGRLRLWRLRDEILRARTKDAFGILWDKRHWNTDLTMRLAMVDAEASSIVLFIDVDNLKQVNEKASHLVGDEILRIIFQTVFDLVAATGGDAYRWGGDEITALLPGLDLNAGKVLGEAIRATVEHQCSLHPKLVELDVTTTVSVGVGGVKGRTTPDAVTEGTAALMKKVKAAGKNQVVAELLPLD